MIEKKYFASWLMLPKCNFSCVYCYYAVPIPGTKTYKPLQPSKSIVKRLISHIKSIFGLKKKKPLPVKPKIFTHNLIESLKKTDKDWIIGMTGGEPFLYPDFVEVCKELIKHYRIAIDTNLSLDSKVREFAEAIDPKMVEYIYVSTHIRERERRKDVNGFIDRVLLLKKKGFRVTVNYVLHPDLIERFEKDHEFFKSRGIALSVRPIQGKFNGKIYPSSYTDSEKKLILKYSPKVKSYPANFKGIPCNAGRNFIRINDAGEVMRCASDKKTLLGNIFYGIKLFNQAMPCTVDKCHCFGADLIEIKNT
ncbi:MAG: radical SAM protein [DPANN group archaeon]|nr:radical SAM protein [DPANN group archaeon]